MKPLFESWQFWALLSAAFAALTAIFAKVGVENVGSDFATLIRTLVILMVVAGILAGTGQWQSPGSVSAPNLRVSRSLRDRHRRFLAMLLPGSEARRRLSCRTVDKLSVVLVAIFSVVFLGERLSGPHWTGVALIATGAVLLAVGEVRNQAVAERMVTSSPSRLNEMVMPAARATSPA